MSFVVVRLHHSTCPGRMGSNGCVRSNAWICDFSSMQSTRRRSGRSKSNDIANLVDKQRISQQLEGLAAIRLQRDRLAKAVHTGDRQAGGFRHRPVLQWVAAVAATKFRAGTWRPSGAGSAARDRGHERVKLSPLNGWASGRLRDGGRVRLGQHAKRGCRIEDQATRQNPYEPASHASSQKTLYIMLDMPIRMQLFA